MIIREIKKWWKRDFLRKVKLNRRVKIIKRKKLTIEIKRIKKWEKISKV